jgi:hypothetical protein
MKYELAKELKDAGFPQMEHVGRGLLLIQDILKPDKGENPYAPTLSELIEACEPFSWDYFSLECVNDGWYSDCGTIDSVNGETRYVETGTTPTEAVARLWLSLNKK